VRRQFPKQWYAAGRGRRAGRFAAAGEKEASDHNEQDQKGDQVAWLRADVDAVGGRGFGHDEFVGAAVVDLSALGRDPVVTGIVFLSA